MGFKRYTIHLLATSFIVLTIVPAVNWIVDPFWYFRVVEVPGFNEIKPAYHLYERQVKSALVAKLHPDAIILGSSFSEIGLSPSNAAFADGGRLRGYNLAVPWSHGAELYCYALFSLEQPGLKRLVLGGFGTQAEPCTKYQYLGKPDYTQLLLSKTAFSATLKTLHEQGGRQQSTADGMWTYLRYLKGFRNDRDIMSVFAYTLPKCGSLQKNRGVDIRMINRSKPATDESTAGLRNIIRLAREKNVQLILIDYPKHVTYYEQMRACGRMEDYWSELWRIASIVEQEAGADSHQVEFWTFYGYSEANGERVNAGVPMAERLWQDEAHFNPEVGHVAFDAIFGSKPGFGHKVKTQDFDRMLADIENERRTFLHQNPWVLTELEELRQVAARQKSNPADVQ